MYLFSGTLCFVENSDFRNIQKISMFKKFRKTVSSDISGKEGEAISNFVLYQTAAN